MIKFEDWSLEDVMDRYGIPVPLFYYEMQGFAWFCALFFLNGRDWCEFPYIRKTNQLIMIKVDYKVCRFRKNA